MFGNLGWPVGIDWFSSGEWGRVLGFYYPKPVPPLGKWYFAFPYYFAATFMLFKWKILFRVGFRYTEVTNSAGEIDSALSYYNFPALPALR